MCNFYYTIVQYNIILTIIMKLVNYILLTYICPTISNVKIQLYFFVYTITVAMMKIQSGHISFCYFVFSYFQVPFVNILSKTYPFLIIKNITDIVLWCFITTGFQCCLVVYNYTKCISCQCQVGCGSWLNSGFGKRVREIFRKCEACDISSCAYVFALP